MKCSISIVQRYLKLFSNEKKHRSFSVIECNPAAQLIVIVKPCFSKLLCVMNSLIFLFYPIKGKENPIWNFCSKLIFLNYLNGQEKDMLVNFAVRTIYNSSKDLHWIKLIFWQLLQSCEYLADILKTYQKLNFVISVMKCITKWEFFITVPDKKECKHCTDNSEMGFLSL